MLSFNFVTALSKASKVSEIDNKELPCGGDGSIAQCVIIDEIMEGRRKDLVK